ncbi:uncharacterized protein [Henckelia pumila]|uniref:uncharacterized protein n=1 Tax=Henckelia pumila TaxID=405737 RepID=UPI003C6E3007
MRTAQSRQKSYADQRRRYLEFAVGDHVFLKVSPMKGVMHFVRRDKLNPRYIGPFEVLERIDTLAYRFALPPNLAAVHNVFHVSVLRKYTFNPSHVLDFEPLQLSPELAFEENPIRVLAHEERRLRTRFFLTFFLVGSFKVCWLMSKECLRVSRIELDEFMKLEKAGNEIVTETCTKRAVVLEPQDLGKVPPGGFPAGYGRSLVVEQPEVEISVLRASRNIGSVVMVCSPSKRLGLRYNLLS